jgi:excisionase family DNA binding protein
MQEKNELVPWLEARRRAASGSDRPQAVDRSEQSLTVTIRQAATILGISTSAAYEFARRGDIPTFKLGARVLVSRKRLQEMIDGATDGVGPDVH